MSMEPVPPREGLFDRIADAVSGGMGKKTNILIWLFAILGWVFLFALGGKKIDSGTWLPAWFTSLGFNFPLNIVTTVAELFIGFLVAANALRIQRVSDLQTKAQADQTLRIGEVEDNLVKEMQENTELTRKVHDLTQTISSQTCTLDEIHRHVEALTTNAGLDVGEFSAPMTQTAPVGAHAAPESGVTKEPNG
jgi:hypothetical protein